jgi:chromosome partitioning protein
VRKLLVASQKGGVGKTTTSINLAAATAMAGTRVLLLDADPLSNVSAALNLAQHSRRQSLRNAGAELPGVLVPEVIPGLDVLSPYEDGSCTDQELDDILRVIGAVPFCDCYGCLIIDSPPFMGANPSQLLRSCDEFVLVMRAEPMAYRTLPAFLEMVQRARRGPEDIQMRGILLTLPDGEIPGGRWERELRGRFGGRILSQVIPYDEEVGKSLLEGQIIAQVNPDSSASIQYRNLAQSLALARETRATRPSRITMALVQAASGVQLGGPPAREHNSAVRKSAPPEAAETSPDALMPAANGAETFDENSAVNKTVLDDKQSPRDPGRRPKSGAKAPLPPVSPSAPGKKPASYRRSADDADVRPRPSRAPAPVPPTAPPQSFIAQLWPLWVALAAVGGVGLRFVPQPESALPMIVGVTVTAVIVVLTWLLLSQQEERSRSTPAPTPPQKSTRPSKLHVNSKGDVATRLNSLARRHNRPSKRDVREK